MPSVWTQTPWSWLQDLARINALDGERSLGVLEGATKEEPEKSHLHSQSDPVAQVSCAPDQGCLAGHDSSICKVAEASERERESKQPDCHDQSHSPETASLSHQGVEKADNAPSLPQLVPMARENSSELQDHMPSTSCSTSLKLPPILTTQLQEIDFPASDQESSSSSDEDDDDDREENANSKLQKFPDLQVSDLPLPAILQYLRESESLASEYFSLRNKHSVDVNTCKEGEVHKEDRDKQIAKDPEVEVSFITSGSDVCEFCGQQSPRQSLLSSTTKEQEERDEFSFCCEEYKEFCLLVAVCLRQMVERRSREQPRKITVVQREKKTIQKTAQERAIAMMHRKNKWEQLRKKRLKQLQSTSFYSLTKQTKTIQFSLVSPSVTTTGWLVRPSSTSTSSHRHRQQKREKRGRKSITDSKLLPPEVIEKLKQTAPPPCDLEVKRYNGGHLFSSLLPDGTGQCYYPSGKIAVLVFAPYPGILAYLAYEDSDHPQVLAYVDELGRLSCCNTDGKIRLLLTPSTGVEFDHQGHVKRKWVWQDHNTLLPPLTLTLNRHISIRCTSQDAISLVFSARQQQIKFSIIRKIKEGCLLTSNQTAADIEPVESYLRRTQTRMRYLLDSLQQGNQVQKLADLRSVYAPKKAAATHKRSKSVGAITLRKPLVH